MQIFRKRSSPPSAAEASESGGGPYRTRYDIAREGYEIRVNQLARALDQSSLRNYLSVLANAVLGIGIVVIAMRGGVRPIFIPYDQFGRVIQYEDLSRFKNPARGFVESELARWLVNVRGIYFGNPVAQMDRVRAARWFLTAESEAWLKQYYKPDDRNPGLLLRDLSRTVEIVSISKDPERPLWYLQWRELDQHARGGAVESIWQATLKVDFRPGQSEAAVWANPAGVRISSIEWNRLRDRPATPTPSHAIPPPAPPPGPADTTVDSAGRGT